MSETHHRVKNNLQVISALLDMQEMQHEEVVPVSEIVRLRQHVKSLSAIHDLLTFQAKPEAFDPITGSKTGLELVQTLARLDLQGKTRFENRTEGGAWAVVEFPILSTTRTAGEQ